MVMDLEKIHQAGCAHSVHTGVGALNSVSSISFLPLEGGGSEVVPPMAGLTPTLSLGGERENEVKNDYIRTASQNCSNGLFATLSIEGNDP